ncbi:hypothetical protein [Methanosarcina sp. 1.H.T.1A.1]|uniref:DUF7289 family protein n=1 Tax=Methanosarcina sp. 1.H.T.1A.1 TaxID=1483602 RepID=UPI000AC55051|nr:hypothetical protein [Methanosarcina sp. 1.H.T.1A.1]
MSRKSLLKSESAAAIAIAAVLLLGLAFTAIAVVKLNYTPEWKIDAERDYSYDSWSNMEDVKTRADMFTRFMSSDINYPYGLSATVPFSMGGGDVPVFEPSKSNSKLAVNTEDCTMSITFGNNTRDPVHCGGITYYSENRQYPDQVFRYENGALILAQGENSQMKHDPLFNITKDMGNYTVTFNAINLTGEPESVSSSTLTALRLTGCSIGHIINSDPEADGVIDSFNLSISTHYTDAWATYFNNTAKDKGLVYGTDYTIESVPHDYVCLSFLSTGNKNYNIHVNQTVLCAELGRKGGEALPDGSGNVMKLGTWYYFDTFSGTYNGMVLSPSPDPALLIDYDPLASLPTGDSQGVQVTPYYSKNEFSKSIDEQKNLQLTFGFNNYTKFESSPSKATILMVYKYDKVQNEPEMESQVGGKSVTTNKIPCGNWIVYNNTYTFSMSPSSPSSLTFNLDVKAWNNEQGTFHIDYLAVRLD